MSTPPVRGTRTKAWAILIGALALIAAIVAVIVLSIPPKAVPEATLPTSDMLTGSYDWGEYGSESPTAPVVTVDENGCFTTRGESDASPEPMLIMWPTGSEKLDDAHVIADDRTYGHGSELPYTVVAISVPQAVDASEGRGAELERLLAECEFDGNKAMVAVLQESVSG